MSSAVVIAPEVVVDDEMERAWQVLSANSSPIGLVRSPVHLLKQQGLSPFRARALLLNMKERGWIRPNNGGEALYSITLIREVNGSTAAVAVARVSSPPIEPIASPAPREKEVTEKKPPTQAEIDAVLYGALLEKLLRQSFYNALDGYVYLEEYRGAEMHFGFDEADDVLATLVARGYCSLWVIREDVLVEAKLSPKMDPKTTLVCVEFIPVAAPSKNEVRTEEEKGHRSVSRSYSYDAPKRAAKPPRIKKTRKLPSWHPFSWMEDGEAPEEVPHQAPQEVAPPTPPTPEPPPVVAAQEKPPPKVRVPREALPQRLEREDQELDRACYMVLLGVMKEDRCVYAYMALLAPTFNKHGVHHDSHRRAAIQRLIESGFIEQRGRSSVRVLDREPPSKPAPMAPPPLDQIEVGYQALVRKKSRIAGDDGHFFTTFPKQALGIHSPHLGDAAAEVALTEMERRGWIRRVQTGSSFYVILLRT